MKHLGVELFPYKKILEELRADRGTYSSSAASSIADLLRYMEYENTRPISHAIL